jgi:putative ATP-dependent endonuclease of OLD family
MIHWPGTRSKEQIMYLFELFVENYRIFGNRKDNRALSVTLNKGLNVIVGENDCGKTAIIDAIRHLLWTTSLDYNPFSDDDFHVENGTRANSLTIRACFRDLSSAIVGRFLEWLSIEGDDPCLWMTLDAVRHEDVPVTARRRNISVMVRSGKKGDGKPIEGEVREFLRTTYLKPLRDADAELAGGRGSRLSQILQAHPSFKNQDINDFSPESPVVEPKTLRGIMNKAQHGIKTHPVVEGTKEELNQNYLDRFSIGREKLVGDIGIAREMSLREVLEKLELWLQPGQKSELRTRRGLGYNNLLFMATELLLLGQEKDFALPLLMIEEPEAHIHPQLQLRLMDFLEEKSSSADGVQVIVTTHSPKLASRVDVQSVFLMSQGQVFSLRSEHTKLEISDYGFLRRFLDVTKANLFFAKAVVMVEGDAENILLPTIAQLLGRPFTEHGVSIVNVGHTGLFRYARIFQRSDDRELPIPVACVTDRDIPPQIASSYVPKKKNKAGEEIPTYNDELPCEEITRLEQMKKKHNGGPVVTFVSPAWTLEYDLALAGLHQEMHIAVQLAKRARSKGNALTVSETTTVIRQATREIEGLEKRGESAESIAAYVYKPLYRKMASKAETAQYLAYCLNRTSATRERIRDLLPRYIVQAIEHVTGGPEPDDSKNAK